MLATVCTNKQTFIVTDEHARRYATRVSNVLQGTGFKTQTWDKAQPEAPLENVKECAEAMK